MKFPLVSRKFYCFHLFYLDPFIVFDNMSSKRVCSPENQIRVPGWDFKRDFDIDSWCRGLANRYPIERCDHPSGCDTGPKYGYEGGRPVRCGKHRERDMQKLTHPLCEHPGGCGSKAFFGYRGGHLERCLKHHQWGMRNLTRPICPGEEQAYPRVIIPSVPKPGPYDWMPKYRGRCDYGNCQKRCSFGYNGGRPTRCAKHREANMQNLLSRKCDHPDCSITPSFGLEGERPTRCKAHKEEKMVNVKTRRCCFSYEDGTRCQISRKSPGQFCTRHNPDRIQRPTGSSKKACRFLDKYMEKHPGTVVKHVHYDGVAKEKIGKEHAVTLPDGTRTRVDGYIASTRTILEFHGDYWHGNPRRYRYDDVHPITKRTYGEMYIATMQRMRAMVDMGYNVKYIWEHEFDIWEKGPSSEPLPILDIPKPSKKRKRHRTNESPAPDQSDSAQISTSTHGEPSIAEPAQCMTCL